MKSSGRIKFTLSKRCPPYLDDSVRLLTSLEQARAKLMSGLLWLLLRESRPSLYAQRWLKHPGDEPQSILENRYPSSDMKCFGLEIHRSADGKITGLQRNFLNAQSASAAFRWILGHPAHTTRMGFIVWKPRGRRRAMVRFLFIRESGKLFSMKCIAATESTV